MYSPFVAYKLIGEKRRRRGEENHTALNGDVYLKLISMFLFRPVGSVFFIGDEVEDVGA